MRHQNPSRRLPELAAALPLLAHAIIVAPAYGQSASLPDTIQLTGVVRDFRATEEPDGHPDFEAFDGKAGVRIGLVERDLGSDGKPVFKSITGVKLDKEYRAAGHNIMPALYDPALGDKLGKLLDDGQKRITVAASFASWFEDVPGINSSAAVTITLVHQGDGTYVFDSKTDPTYVPLKGFFPINDRVLGNYTGTWNVKGPPAGTTNFHFTFQLAAKFTYDDAANQIFTFVGDDDVWVFINHELVIDLGGVHAAREQSVLLNRLGLQPGETYDLDFFYAERNTFEANCRIETNFVLTAGPPSTISAGFD